MRKGNPLALLVGMQIDTATMEKSMKIFQKLGIKLSYDPTIPLLGIYPEETIIEKDTYTPMFIAALWYVYTQGVLKPVNECFCCNLKFKKKIKIKFTLSDLNYIDFMMRICFSKS